MDGNCNFICLLNHSFWLKLVKSLLGITFQLFKLLCLAKDHGRGSVPEMHIWSISLIRSDLKWCIHLRRSLFVYLNYSVSITADGPGSLKGHIQPTSTVDFVDS